MSSTPHAASLARTPQRAVRAIAEALRDAHRRLFERERQLRQAEEALREGERRRREAEQRLRLAQRMETVGQLAGGIAHDFDNLLTAILGNCRALLGEDGLERPVRQGIEEIQIAADRAASLTRRLGAFQGDAPPAAGSTDTRAVIERVHRLARQMLDPEIDLELDLADDLLPLAIDSTEFEQILLNLVLNAREALEGRGRIAIETRAEDGCGVLRVRDDGPGIPEDAHGRIFEPFYTTREDGHGMGLFTIYGIAHRCGGEVTFRSGDGGAPQRSGTCFEVRLPLAPPTPR